MAQDAAVGDEELKRRNMKGLMAELDTMDTPMMACTVDKMMNTQDCVSHLYSSTPGHGAPGVSQDLLPDELIHHVGQVGDDEDGHHSQGEVCGLHLGSREVTFIHTPWKIDSYGCSVSGGLDQRIQQNEDAQILAKVYLFLFSHLQ